MPGPCESRVDAPAPRAVGSPASCECSASRAARSRSGGTRGGGPGVAGAVEAMAGSRSVGAGGGATGEAAAGAAGREAQPGNAALRSDGDGGGTAAGKGPEARRACDGRRAVRARGESVAVVQAPPVVPACWASTTHRSTAPAPSASLTPQTWPLDLLLPMDAEVSMCGEVTRVEHDNTIATTFSIAMPGLIRPRHSSPTHASKGKRGRGRREGRDGGRNWQYQNRNNGGEGGRKRTVGSTNRRWRRPP